MTKIEEVLTALVHAVERGGSYGTEKQAVLVLHRAALEELAKAQEDAQNEGDLRYAAEDALRTAQQDAERYRTVRDHGWIKLERETMMFLSASAFDCVVDAARSKS